MDDLSVRPKTAKFELAVDETECNWNLPINLKDYVKISDKDLKDKILSKKSCSQKH